MSVAPLTTAATQLAATGMPVVDEARGVGGSDSVRNSSTAVKQAHASAQGFEEMLLQQLAQSLVQSSGLSGESETGESEARPPGEAGASEGGGEAGSSVLSSMLPQTLTESVMHDGGLGLAGQLMGALDRSASATATGSPASTAVHPTGGVSAGVAATSVSPAVVPVAAAAPASAVVHPTGGVSAGVAATSASAVEGSGSNPNPVTPTTTGPARALGFAGGQSAPAGGVPAPTATAAVSRGAIGHTGGASA